MGSESGYQGRLYSLSGSGDSSGRGRRSLNALGTALAAGSTQLIGANPNRIWLLIVNPDAANPVYLALGEDAAVNNQGIPLLANGGWVLFTQGMAWTGSIQAIAIGGNVNLAITEVDLWTTNPEPSNGGGGGGNNPPQKYGVC